jgi:hypothetical protein
MLNLFNGRQIAPTSNIGTYDPARLANFDLDMGRMLASERRAV